MTATDCASPQSLREQIRMLQDQLRRLRLSLLETARERAGSTFPLEAVVMTVGGFEIAVLADQVVEVTPMALVTPVPEAPAPLRGALHYQGRLAAVVDLRVGLRGSIAPLTPDLFLAFVAADTRVFALAVDRVEPVRQFGPEDVEAIGGGIAALPGFVHCLLRSQNGPVALLDPAGLLAATELDRLDAFGDHVAGACESKP